MNIATQYRCKHNKALKQLGHHNERRRKFVADYFDLTRERFSDKGTFGTRLSAPIVQVVLA